MKTIWLKDLKIKEVVEEVVVKETKRKPLFLWMKEKDIYKIEYFDGYIYWYNKDWLQTYYEDSDKYWWKREYKDWLETYYKNSDKNWWKKEDWKLIKYIDWKYYIDWEEAELR